MRKKMKNVLIVIHDMRIGGAQKSLVSFLRCLAEKGEAYRVSLMVIDPTGPFLKEIPETVTLLSPPKPLRWLGSALSKDLFLKHFSIGGLWGECCWLANKKLKRFPKGLNLQQKLWHSWKKHLPELKERFDVAISYMDGVPNYYVAEKVSAQKKVMWVHSEYQKQGYAPTFDRPFYDKAHKIITISPNCKDCIVREFPDMEEKICVLENITSPTAVIEKSQIGESPEFDGVDRLKLLTVARLNPQKGVDLAVEAGILLKKAEVPFLWLVVGDGPEREALQKQILQGDIADCFQLLGGRNNPYPYMKNCDILVQPSRVEGKSIVLDEVKVLCKPVVATNYVTVVDALEHGKTGWIVEMEPEALADGILKLYEDPALRTSMEAYMETLPKGNERELEKYCKIML